MFVGVVAYTVAAGDEQHPHRAQSGHGRGVMRRSRSNARRRWAVSGLDRLDEAVDDL